MALLCRNLLTASAATKNCVIMTGIRTLVSKQLVYSEFGDPTQVVKFRESVVPPLGCQEVLVRMLAAPVNPADINTIQGKYPVKIELPSVAGNEGVGSVEEVGKNVKGIKPGRNVCLPCLPTIPGDEGVGEVVEIGDKVVKLVPGNRVILISKMQGTWRYYGVFHERSLLKISHKLNLAEAAMMCAYPSTAYRMIKDFKELRSGDYVIQNAANSPIGQCVIQLCKCYDIKTFNIVPNQCGYENIKEHLLKLGATTVCTLEEAEQLTSFETSVMQPILALNCLGGRYEDVLLKLVVPNGAIVYYGFAYNLPMAKHCLRPDVEFYSFDFRLWSATADTVEKCRMYNRLTEWMAIGKLKAPMHEPIELKDYIYALRNTDYSDACNTQSFIFDLTVP